MIVIRKLVIILRIKKQSTMELQNLKKTVYSEMAELTKALGNPNRLEIIDLLAQGSVSP